MLVLRRLVALLAARALGLIVRQALLARGGGGLLR